MNIAINILYLIPGQVGGTETYARELISYLQKNKGSDTYYLYCSRESANLFQESGNLRIIILPFNAKSRPMRMLFEQLVLPFYLLAHHIDVVFSLGYSSPWLAPCPSVVTIHDLNWHYHPEDFSRFGRLVWELTVRLSARFASHVVTDSMSSADSLIEVLRLSKSKVTPILHAPPAKLKLTSKQAHTRRTKLGLTSPYISTVVAGHPHKNLITLLRAFKILHQTHPDLTLVVSGLSGRADSMTNQYLAENNLTEHVKILGYIERSDLVAVYMGSSVFVFPSAYEGFGYPVIEAMQYGVPVVSSNAFSLHEVVGSGGVLLDPYDVESYVSEITKLLSSPRSRTALIKRGAKRITELTWESTVQSTLEIIKRTRNQS